MKKRLYIIAVLLVLGSAMLTACGSDPVTEEAQLGVNLENKAKDNVEQQNEDAGNAENMMENMED